MLGEFIRNLRLRRGLSQIEVARRGNFSSAWLSRVEANAIVSPDAPRLRSLARALNTDPDELFSVAGFLHTSEPIERMSETDILDQVDRLLSEVRRRKEQPIRLDERRDGTDPSVRRHSRGGVAVLDRI